MRKEGQQGKVEDANYIYFMPYQDNRLGRNRTVDSQVC